MSRFHKYKLLLDEQLPFRSSFPRLNSIFNLKHIAKDYKNSGLQDIKVYELAKQEKRLLLTVNIKDFKDLIGESKNAGVIGIPSHWSFEKVDTQLTALLSKKKPGELYGKYTSLSEA